MERDLILHYIWLDGLRISKKIVFGLKNLDLRKQSWKRFQMTPFCGSLKCIALVNKQVKSENWILNPII